jgi:hypothetical protein
MAYIQLKLNFEGCDNDWSEEVLFEIIGPVSDHKVTIYAAVEDWLASPDGQAMFSEDAEPLGWSDLLDHMPSSAWAKHGLRLIDDVTYSIEVDGDETFGGQS